jgi:probable HAF family extracellular repeat protein
MLPEYMNRQGPLTGTVFREDGTSGAFFRSQANGLEEIGSLGGDEMSPTEINDAGTIVGFGTTASGETQWFVWSKANGLVDIGTLGGDFRWASDINSSGLVAGYSKIAGGDEHSIALSADGGLIDLGTLAGSRSRGQFVTEVGAIIGVSGAKGHRTHAFVWTEDDGLVEMPSLGRPENADAASRTVAFTGFTIDKKSNASLHAVLWAPSPASSSERVSLHRRAGGPGMRTALVTGQCSRTHSHGTHFGQVRPGFGAVPGPHRLSRVLDGRGRL